MNETRHSEQKHGRLSSVILWLWLCVSFLLVFWFFEWIIKCTGYDWHSLITHGEVPIGGTGVVWERFNFFYVNEVKMITMPPPAGESWRLADHNFHLAQKEGIIESSGELSDKFLRYVGERSVAESSATRGLTIKEVEYSINRTKIPIKNSVGENKSLVHGGSLYVYAKLKASPDAPLGEGFVYLSFRNINFHLPFIEKFNRKITLASSGYIYPNTFAMSVKIRSQSRSNLYILFCRIGIYAGMTLFIFVFGFIIFGCLLEKLYDLLAEHTRVGGPE